MKKYLPHLIVLSTVALMAFACAAHAGDLASLYVGANGVFLADGPFNSDVEGQFNGKVSLSPHLSAVGSAGYGVVNRYWRSAIGARVTSTDVENPNFSVGLGIQYRTYGMKAMGPNEWAPDVSVGYRPWPKQLPRVIVGAQGWYGLTSEKAGMELAARWQFRL
jgi:hypothetical protein